MADQFMYRTLGGASYPTQGTDVTSEQLYSVFDPSRDVFLALFEAAINYELGHATGSVDSASPWGVARVGTKLASSQPVADTYHEIPTKEVLRRADIRFPLLSIGRTGGEFGEETLAIEADTGRWQLDYNLGPLKTEDVRRLGGALNAARNIIQLVVRQGCHAAYAFGARQFGSFKSVRLVNYTMGPADFGERGEGLIFHALSMTIETVEQDGDVEGAHPNYDGATVAIGVEGNGGVLPDVIIGRTEVPVEAPDLL